MSDERNKLKNVISGFSADSAMYDGEQLPEDYFDQIDDSSDLLREVEELRQQLAIAKQSGDLGNMQIGRFGLTATGLIAPDDVSPEEFAHVGRMLFKLEGSLQWLIGDWLMLVDGYQWGDTGTLAAHFGRETQTLYNLKRVSKNVQFSLRRENLSFGHHDLLAAMDEGLQVYWLDRAEHGDVDPTDDDRQIKWSLARLRNEIKIAALPTPSPVIAPGLLDFKAKAKQIPKFGRSVLKAGQGDDMARRAALGSIVDLRKWLDDIEEMLGDG